MLNRRVLVIGATGSLGASMFTVHTAPSDSTYTSFHKNLPHKSWLRLYAGIQQEDTDTHSCHVDGNWPRDLVGALYRNGPGRMELGGRRYQHWFDGDGLVQKWSISHTGEVTHRSRLVHTHKFLHDEARNELSLVGFGTVSEDPLSASGPDAFNVGNISVLPRDNELLALWEGGSAWRMNADTLTTNGKLELSTESAGLPFSAHPRVEPNGTLWNFGYVSHMAALVIWRLDPGAREPKIWIIPRSPMTIPHDFVVTSKHLLLPLPPLHYEPDRAVEHSFIDAHEWHPDRSLDILVMSKDDPNSNFVIELPAAWFFHYSNAWEDEDGVIRFEGFSYDDPSLMYDAFRNVMRGKMPDSISNPQLVQFRVDTKKRNASVKALLDDQIACEFPCIDRRRSTERHEWLTMLAHDARPSSSKELGLFNSVARVHTVSSDSVLYTYPHHEIPEEHLFIPNRHGSQETDGWILGTSLDYVDEKTHLNLFEARETALELVARATLPRLMPLGLHGQFVGTA